MKPAAQNCASDDQKETGGNMISKFVTVYPGHIGSNHRTQHLACT